MIQWGSFLKNPKSDTPFAPHVPDSKIHREKTNAQRAPAICAAMKGATSAGPMPANVFESARATVTAGLANEVDEVNQ